MKTVIWLIDANESDMYEYIMQCNPWASNQHKHAEWMGTNPLKAEFNLAVKSVYVCYISTLCD